MLRSETPFRFYLFFVTSVLAIAGCLSMFCLFCCALLSGVGVGFIWGRHCPPHIFIISSLCRTTLSCHTLPYTHNFFIMIIIYYFMSIYDLFMIQPFSFLKPCLIYDFSMWILPFSHSIYSLFLQDHVTAVFSLLHGFHFLVLFFSLFYVCVFCFAKGALLMMDQPFVASSA